MKDAVLILALLAGILGVGVLALFVNGKLVARRLRIEFDEKPEGDF